MAQARTEWRSLLVALAITGGLSWGTFDSHAAASSRSDVHFWSVGGVQQWGPDATYYGTRVLRVTYCDDDVCHTPVTWFWGGELLAASEGRAVRAVGSFSIFAFPFGSEFKSLPGRHRASIWLRPEVGIDSLWDAPDPGLGVSAGLGAEFILRPTVRSHLAFGVDRYFSTVLGTRNQVSLTFRWGVLEKTHYP